jgi:hypothetical protein
LSSDNRYSSISRLRAVYPWLSRAWIEPTYFEGLRNAGMPEE